MSVPQAFTQIVSHKISQLGKLFLDLFSNQKGMNIDITKLQTVSNYASHLQKIHRKAITKRTVYNMIKDNRVNSILIDGVKFIVREDLP